MPTEEVTVDQGEVVEDQIDQQIPNAEPEQEEEDVAVYEDGSEPVEPEEPTEEVEEEEAAGPEPSSTDADTVEEEPKVESQEIIQLRELKQKVDQLNKALHQERTKKKEEPAEEVLSQAQLKEIIREHGDDPEVMFNVMDYMSKQAAKKAGEETLDVQRVSKMREANESLVSKNWPALSDPDSELRTRVEAIKQDLNIGDHPMADYLAVSALSTAHIDQVKNQWFEAGKQAAMKEKSEKERKSDVKSNTLEKSTASPARSPGKNQKMYDPAIKQLNLSPGQAKVYKSLMSKNNSMVEA